MPSRRGGPNRRGAGGRGVAAILFVTLGLAAAFVVSAVAGWFDGAGAAAEARRVARAVGDPADVRVEVLNGAGTSGLARDATAALREAGFDVVFFGNARAFDRTRSVVLDRVGRPERARAVAAALGIDSVASAPDEGLLLDVSVLLGDDWPPAPPDRTPLRERIEAWLDDGR